ncbi:MAG: tRNA (adenosine(37)-N6)-threonylcarbamoyltransferase complex ATPase subunit type 1 TsaE [Gammaproteobacteria bacterium]|nr:MAG: tRNA (adenosine(37)-N6)-threonylcarbamoyltransferase complex ATPase subunit type 1 TsaE [Gammaproteobacteria bacterium]
MVQHTVYLADEAAQTRFGEHLAPLLSAALLVNLYGDLGTGKTTLVRGLLRGLGYSGRVRSPTFTLMETYETTSQSLCHLDLYRLSDMEELEMLGIRDYLDGNWTVWLEWPQRVPELAQQADIDVTLQYSGDGRFLTMDARTDSGVALLERLT